MVESDPDDVAPSGRLLSQDPPAQHQLLLLGEPGVLYRPRPGYSAFADVAEPELNQCDVASAARELESRYRSQSRSSE